MIRDTRHFDRFIASAYRRLLVVRLLERIGLSILYACGAALIIVAYRLWHAKPAVAWVEVFLLIGLVAGVIWAVVRRPKPVMAALLADEQLKLSELLSTAYLARQSASYQTHPWLDSLLSEAEGRCASVSPARLTFRRLGPRTWGGVTLSLALVLTLAELGPSASPSKSENGPTLNGSRISLATADRSAQTISFLEPIDRPILLSDPDDLKASTFGQNEPSHTAEPDTASAKSESSDSQAKSQAGGDGQGSGSARTETSAAGAVPQAADQHPPLAVSKPSNAGEVASGGGAQAVNPKESEKVTGGTRVAAGSNAAPPPPWAGGDWAADVTRATASLNSGRIPAAYHDLVRGYFRGDAQ